MYGRVDLSKIEYKLDKEIINSLQKNFAAEMKELNYL